MFCTNCGNQLNNNDNFCPNCGHNIKKINKKNIKEDNSIIYILISIILIIAYIFLKDPILFIGSLITITTGKIKYPKNIIIKIIFWLLIIFIILIIILMIWLMYTCITCAQQMPV